MLVNTDNRLERIFYHLGGEALSRSVRGFLDWVAGDKTHILSHGLGSQTEHKSGHSWELECVMTLYFLTDVTPQSLSLIRHSRNL